jgi:NodT family efflux transporter outer membrane factor (OMF) lipoprotein
MDYVKQPGPAGDTAGVRRAKPGLPAVRALATVMAGVLVAGCAAGPDFKPPDAPDVPGYTATPVPAETTSAPTMLGDPQRFGGGVDVNAEWWTALGSPRLDALVDEAFRANPTLAEARAALRQAREIHSARAGSTLYPQVDAGLGAERQRMNPGAFGQDGDAREFSLYNAGVEVHYRLDLSGGNRRALEGLAARADFRRYELAGAGLALAGNVVTSAINQGRLSGQMESTAAMLSAREEQLQIARERVRLGTAAPDEVLASQREVEETRAELIRLRLESRQNEHLLAVLAGREPGAGPMPDFALGEFTLPADLPLVLPSELVRRRPDIRAAEALLQAANAEYGVAVARLYPQVDISAGLGSQALSTGALFGSGTGVWSLVSQLTQPLFNQGLPPERRASLAAFDAAAANYQRVVLESLRNVADVLRAIEHDADALVAHAAADAAARGSVRSVQRQYELGTASYVQLLIAQESAEQARLRLIAAQARRLADTAALFQAMGGGATPDIEPFVDTAD